MKIRYNKKRSCPNFLCNTIGEGTEDASVDFSSGDSAKRAGLHVLRAPDPSLRLRYFFVIGEATLYTPCV